MPEDQITMKREKDCKRVVRYAAEDEEAAVSNIYLSKKFATPMPEEIVVTVSTP